MLGNDIVDLKLASVQSNWRRKGYLEKIFTDVERNYILGSSAQDLCVWQLWSLKESAYKIYNRQTGIRTFEPVNIECEVCNIETGSLVVRINGKTYFATTSITEKYVHSTAALSVQDLNRAKTDIYFGTAKSFNYHALNPKSISHHGSYLALVDFI